MDDLFLLLFLVSFSALIAGMIRPVLLQRVLKNKTTRKNILKIFGGASVASFILFGITTEPPATPVLSMEESQLEDEIVVYEDTYELAGSVTPVRTEVSINYLEPSELEDLNKNNEVATNTDGSFSSTVRLLEGINKIEIVTSNSSGKDTIEKTIIRELSREEIQTQKDEAEGITREKKEQEAGNAEESRTYDVTSVVDGDTAKVSIDGRIETIRIIGLDTPETVHPQRPVECFGKEATSKARELLEGTKVRLEADSTQDNRDRYDRLLRYIILEDGSNFSKVMIEQGYGFEYTYRIPYKYQSEFKQAETDARNNKRGLWADNTCAGGTVLGESSSPSPSPEPTPAVNNSDGVVKMSSTGICHAPGTTYYNRTKNFTPYNSLQACLDAGGRLPKR